MNLLASIGHTPLIRLTNVVPKNSAEVWVKYEGNNPTGSCKDRMALGVINKAMARGDLKQAIASVNILEEALEHPLRLFHQFWVSNLLPCLLMFLQQANFEQCEPMGQRLFLRKVLMEH